MRYSILYIALILVLPLFILACDDNSNSINGTALTENDFVQDSALRADPEKGVIVTFLESPDSEAPENDTGEVGTDVIPVTFRQLVERTFCWDGDDPDAMEFMEIRDSEGNLVLGVEANGDCITQVIQPGDYVMIFNHDGRSEDTHPIFIIPDPNDTQQAKQSHGLFNGFKQTVANILGGLKSALYKDAIAQVEENINTLIKTNNCQDCDLIGANLSGADLQGAELTGAIVAEADLSGANLQQAILNKAILNKTNLSGADLSGANLQQVILGDSELIGAKLGGANLSGADLFRAKLQDADLGEANLQDANLDRASLVEANLQNADLTRASLNRADLTRADLTRANLTGADLSQANLSGTILRRALWIDGSCICSTTSVGACNACR